jgi:hypothetical protein
VHDTQAGGRAPLAGAAERSLGDAGGREIQIGIGHHDHSVLSAHLAGDFGETPGDTGVDVATDLTGSGEGDGPHYRVIHHGLSHVSPRPDQQRENALRKAGLRQDLDKLLRDERRERSGLEEHDVSGHESGSHFPDRLRPGEVPRGNDRDDPHGLAEREEEGARHLRWTRLASHPEPFPGVPLEKNDPSLDFAPGFAEQFSLLPGQEAREFVEA